METGGGIYETFAEFLAEQEDADAVVVLVANPTRARGRLEQEVCVNVESSRHAMVLRLLADHLRGVAGELEAQAAKHPGSKA